MPLLNEALGYTVCMYVHVCIRKPELMFKLHFSAVKSNSGLNLCFRIITDYLHGLFLRVWVSDHLLYEMYCPVIGTLTKLALMVTVERYTNDPGLWSFRQACNAMPTSLANCGTVENCWLSPPGCTLCPATFRADTICRATCAHHEEL